jgi:hypothetical protein
MNEQVLVADATYTTAPWEVLFEYALIRHTFNKGTPVINHTGYAQISYLIAERWRPYARGEIQQMSDREIFLASPREKRVFGGFRFDPIPALGIKLEGAWINRDDTSGFLAQAQVAWVM